MKIGTLEMKIARVEGFRVRVMWDSRNVRSDREGMPPWPYERTMLYLALKTVHVLAAVAFLGNIIVGGFWKALADRTGNAAIMAHTIDGIIKADRIFTIPAVIVLAPPGILWGIGTRFS